MMSALQPPAARAALSQAAAFPAAPVLVLVMTAAAVRPGRAGRLVQCLVRLGHHPQLAIRRLVVGQLLGWPAPAAPTPTGRVWERPGASSACAAPPPATPRRRGACCGAAAVAAVAAAAVGRTSLSWSSRSQSGRCPTVRLARPARQTGLQVHHSQSRALLSHHVRPRRHSRRQSAVSQTGSMAVARAVARQQRLLIQGPLAASSSHIMRGVDGKHTTQIHRLQLPAAATVPAARPLRPAQTLSRLNPPLPRAAAAALTRWTPTASRCLRQWQRPSS
mmetsp:Transcript_20623/g.52332  ORF Transcript_20623/g.52332 Transcript_20623/m.52332 type:complete len:277 (+) Transcript_20623:1125-1955(+)